MTNLAAAVDALPLTCAACPTQISGELPDGRRVYFRYRWGFARITVDGEEIFAEQLGDFLDGVMDETEARRLILAALTDWSELP